MLRVVSYNILHPGLASYWKTLPGYDEATQADNWDKRLPLIAQTLHEIDADLVCLQETDATLSAQLVEEINKLAHTESPNAQQHSPHYAVANTAANLEIKYNTLYGTSILYKPSVLRLENSATIAHLPTLRQACTAQFTHMTSTKNIAVLSAHLKGYNLNEDDYSLRMPNQAPGSHELDHYLTELNKCAAHNDIFIVSGDFNEDDRFSGQDFSRTDIAVNHGYSTHHDRSSTCNSAKLDWIFCKNARIDTAYTLNNSRTRLSSDHTPVIATLTF